MGRHEADWVTLWQCIEQSRELKTTEMPAIRMPELRRLSSL